MVDCSRAEVVVEVVAVGLVECGSAVDVAEVVAADGSGGGSSSVEFSKMGRRLSEIWADWLKRSDLRGTLGFACNYTILRRSVHNTTN